MPKHLPGHRRPRPGRRVCGGGGGSGVELVEVGGSRCRLERVGVGGSVAGEPRAGGAVATISQVGIVVSAAETECDVQAGMVDDVMVVVVVVWDRRVDGEYLGVGEV